MWLPQRRVARKGRFGLPAPRRPIRDLFPLPGEMTFVQQKETDGGGEREKEEGAAAARRKGNLRFCCPLLLLLSFFPAFLVLPSAAAVADSICRSLLTRRGGDASLGLDGMRDANFRSGRYLHSDEAASRGREIGST